MKRDTGGALGAALVCLALATGLAVLAMALAGLYLVQNVRVDKTRSKRGETVHFETPFGSMRVQEHSSLDPRRLGVPLYPGAIREEGDQNKLASFEIDFGGEHKEFSFVAGEYSTPDTIEDVIGFYRKQLPHWIIHEGRRGCWEMDYTEGGFRRIVAIRKDHARTRRTRIGVASVGEPASN